MKKKRRPINVEKMSVRLRRPEYVGAFDDLLAFTGLQAAAACRLILKSGLGSRREMKFVLPKGKVENELFYRCCREYLFLNTFRPIAQLLIDARKDGLVKGPVLDFGAGMGNDSVWMTQRGYDVSYHEIGIVQREFMRFRIKKNNFKIEILWPYVGGKYDPLGCITREYGTLFLRDVLEHIPDYFEMLKRLVGHLLPGGVILEHTPWNARGEDGKWIHHSVLHCEETVSLKKLLGGLGMKPIRRGVWRKDG